MTSSNEAGVACLLDGGVPRTITFLAHENISGGQFVLFSGAGGAVSSGANTFIASDIIGVLVTNSTTGSGIEQINGLALYDVTSGSYGAAATRGAYIVKCGGSVVEGTIVEAISNHSVQTLGSKIVPVAAGAGYGGVPAKIPGASNIGRTVVGGISGTNAYCVVYLNI